MITEVVTFKVPEGTTREEHASKSRSSALAWGENPDLIRKYYLFDPERSIAGGIYLWKEKAHAEKWHGAEWRAEIKKLYDSVPKSEFFETPIVVDNVTDEIVKG